MAEVERLLQVMRAPSLRCASTQEAIALARQGPLCCLIISLPLAELGARALIDTLRECAPGLPVIIIVDNLAVSEAVTVMHSGAHAVIDSRSLSTGLMHHLTPLLQRR